MSLNEKLANRFNLYTANQYNQLKQSIGEYTYTPVPESPQEAKIQRMTTTGKEVRDKALIDFINRNPDSPHILIIVREVLEGKRSIGDLLGD